MAIFGLFLLFVSVFLHFFVVTVTIMNALPCLNQKWPIIAGLSTFQSGQVLIIWDHVESIWTLLDLFRQILIVCPQNAKTNRGIQLTSFGPKMLRDSQGVPTDLLYLKNHYQYVDFLFFF